MKKSDKEFLIAHVKGDNKLPLKKLKRGGILKELNQDNTGDKRPELFLECTYYLD